MDRTNGAGHVNHLFVAEDPALLRPPTEFTPEWFNAVQEEISAPIEHVGMVLDPNDDTQLLQAMQKMIQASRGAVVYEQAVFAPGVTTSKAVYWDVANSRYDLALADGTVKQNVRGFADVENGLVYAFGLAPFFAGLTPDASYYLSVDTAGEITSVVPANNVVKIGIASADGVMVVDIIIMSHSFGKQMFHSRDERTSGSAGGSSLTATTQTRDLNTVVANTIPGAFLLGGRITLPAGTYRVFASAPSMGSDGHRIRLQNITDGTTALLGTSERSGTSNSVVSRSFIHGAVFSITGTKVFELQHYTQTGKANDGLGAAAILENVEIFSDLVIWKE